MQVQSMMAGDDGDDPIEEFTQIDPSVVWALDCIVGCGRNGTTNRHKLSLQEPVHTSGLVNDLLEQMGLLKGMSLSDHVAHRT